MAFTGRTHDHPDHPGRSNRGRWVIALVVLALVCVIVGAFALHRSGDGPGRSESQAPAGDPTASAPSSPAPSSPPASTPDSGTGAVPTSTPKGVHWELFRGLALPSSRAAGPYVIDGPVLRNYEHTPTGALVAATQISARYLITPNGGWRRVLKEQVVPGPGRDAFTTLRAGLTDEAPAQGFAQFAGFRFVTYTPQVAVISLANRASSGKLTATNTTVHWSNGDWKVEIAASGLAMPQAITNLAGYVPWSGVS